MPPDRGSPYGRPYGEGHGEGYPYGTSPYGHADDASDADDPYAQPEAFQAAVDALSDPLSDPLPGQITGRGAQGERGGAQGYLPEGYPGQAPEPYAGGPQSGPAQPQGYGPDPFLPQQQDGVSPWFRPHRDPGEGVGEPGGPGPSPDAGTPSRSSALYSNPAPEEESWPRGRREHPAGPGSAPGQAAAAGQGVPPGTVRRLGPGTAAGYGEGPGARSAPGPGARSAPGPAARHAAPAPPAGTGVDSGAGIGPGGAGPAAGGPRTGARPPALPGRDGAAGGVRGGASETTALPAGGEPENVAGSPGRHAAPGQRTGTARPSASAADDDEAHTVGLRRSEVEAMVGRAARRRAAQRRGGAKGGPQEPVRAAGTRLEARRAARARREGPAIVASRFLGEVFISAGVLMLLFVAYQLWWTNVLAGQEAGGAANDLSAQWDGGGKDSVDPERKAGTFAPGEGFAILYIPKLDVRVPIAEGVSKTKVLDKGLVGHYNREPVKSGMPWDKKGNFALAGHRNTHGEPFRYINRLVAGDKMVVETGSKFYTYELANRLPSTSPKNTGVIEPIPKQSGFNQPGRYITLTTCTPEFTSTYRLIVWGKMVEERPRSKGKPDALVG